MNLEEIKSKLETSLSGVEFKLVRDSLLVLKPQDILKVSEFVQTELKLDYLSSLTGVDYLEFLEVVYHFYSMEDKNISLTLRIRTPKDVSLVPSITSVFRSAEYQERETYDMYGIVFEGHPDLRRIFMWDNFEGFPMLKGYKQEDSEVLEMADIRFLQSKGIEVSEDIVNKAVDLDAQGKRATFDGPTDNHK